jgi:hypothetical protein
MKLTTKLDSSMNIEQSCGGHGLLCTPLRSRIKLLGVDGFEYDLTIRGLGSQNERASLVPSGGGVPVIFEAKHGFLDPSAGSKISVAGRSFRLGGRCLTLLTGFGGISYLRVKGTGISCKVTSRPQRVIVETDVTAFSTSQIMFCSLLHIMRTVAWTNQID